MGLEFGCIISLINDGYMIEVKESIIINTSPKKIYNFLTSLHKFGVYKQWHQKDHISYKLLKGNGNDVGSVIFADEYIGKRILRLKFKLVKANSPFYLEYKLVFPTSLLFKGNGTFEMKPINSSQTKFTAYISVGSKNKIVDRIRGKIINIFYNTEDLVKHVKEEGINIKSITEKI